MPDDPFDPFLGSNVAQTPDASPALTQAANDAYTTPASAWGAFSPGSLLHDPEFRRQAVYDALIQGGLGLIAASAPRTGPPQNIGSLFGALAGGAAQGVEGSADRFMKLGTQAAQLRNLQMQQQMYPAALKMLQSGSTYNPYGDAPGPGQPAGAQPAGTPQQNAISAIEGNYDSIGPVADVKGSRGYGKYQVMDYNIGPWTKEALGKELTPQEFLADPKAQDAVFNTKFGQYREKYGDVGAAKAWFAGEKGMSNPNARDVNGMTVARYGDQFVANGGAPGAARGGAGPTMAALPAFQGPGVGDIQPGALPPGSAPQLNLPQAAAPPPIDQTTAAATAPQAPGAPQAPPPAAGPPPVSPIPPPGGVQLPRIPINPPDPSRYAALKALGGSAKIIGDAMEKADEAKYKAAKDLYELSLKSQTAQREARAEQRAQSTEQRAQSAEQRAERTSKVLPSGAPNTALASAESQIEMAKKTAENSAHEKTVFGGSQWAEVPPEQFRKLANPQVISLADGLQKGTVRLSTLGNSVGRGGTPITKADVITAGQKLYGDQFNPDAGDIRHKFEQDIKDPDTQAGKTVFALNTVYKHLDRYQDLVLAQQNGDKPRINALMKQLNHEAGYSKYSSAEALQPALGTEIANVIKGAQLNMPEVEGAIDLLKTTNTDPQMLNTVATLRHAMGDRQSTFTEKAADAYVPKERIDRIVGPSAKEAIQHFDKVQADYRAAHPEKFGGAPNAPVAPSMDAINAEMKRRGLAR